MPAKLFVLLAAILLMLCACKTYYPDSAIPKASGRYAADFAPGERELRAYYQEVYSQLGDKYIRRIYYPSTSTLTDYQEYQDADFRVRDGQVRSYYDDGPLRSVGQYKDNKPVGEWTSYYRDGTVSQIATYDSDNGTVTDRDFNR